MESRRLALDLSWLSFTASLFCDKDTDKKFKFAEQSWSTQVKLTLYVLQDLVEALSTVGDWKVPRKLDQQSYARDKDGNFVGHEDDPPFVYHKNEDGDLFLSSHYTSLNLQEIELTDLQKEAVW